MEEVEHPNRKNLINRSWMWYSTSMVQIVDSPGYDRLIRLIIRFIPFLQVLTVRYRYKDSGSLLTGYE
jgi:hypothetical protein